MATVDDPETDQPTGHLPTGQVPEIAPLAKIAAEAMASQRGAPVLPAAPPESLTTAAGAMRDEEVERTRLFIRMGWLLSVVVIATVPFVRAPDWLAFTFVGGMVLGMIVSYGFHRAFADPARFTQRALMTLAVICVINGHVAVLFYGPYTGAPLIIVIGIHFIARTEEHRVAQIILASAIACYSTMSLAIISGLIDDMGVFAADKRLDRPTLITATIFVLGTYVLAYYTARVFRFASLASIDDLQKATRMASQREALMDELRADLERALRVGGPGRYTEQTVGKFRLGAVLGRGAIGEVYEAVHVETNEPAAIKLLRREHLGDATQVARFLREATAAGSLDSPYVVRALEAAPPDAGLAYLAMERLHGQTLSELLRREPRLSDAATLELCRHAGAGIDAAAAAAIVHRDLKPQNLMLTDDGVWKILDFGIATLADDSGTLTRGDAIGTPSYMAPEQAQGKRVDTRADVYALAAVAYRCMTGRHPFSAPDTPSLLYAVVHRMPLRPGSLADLPADVDRWFAIALAKSPDDRFSSGAVLVEHFAKALAGELDPALRRRADRLIRKLPWEAA